MKFSKSLVFGSLFAAVLAINPVYAQDSTKITSAETGSLATVAVIDKNEILVSVVAVNKKVDSGIADFAKMMIDQHGSNLTQILEMAHNLHLTLQGGEAETLAAQGKKEMMTLGGLEGQAFETAYVNAMVTGHQGALDLIDKHLMKTAKSEEIKKFLTDTRAVVMQHLEHAKKLQEEMKS